jgi:hypothetical protein
LSGNILSTLYAHTTLTHPTEGAVGIWNCSLSFGPARDVLAHILNGTALFSRAYFKLGMTNGTMFVIAGYSGARSESAGILNNSDMWDAASGGAKSNKVAISMTAVGSAARVTLQSKSGFAINHGSTSAANDITMKGRTDWVSRNFTAGANFTIGIGELDIANSVRPGSWCHYMQNRISDLLFGGTTVTFPGTYYFGLSTTPIAADGTGITEPSGGSYARVSKTVNSTNFEGYSDLRWCWANKTAITFPAPTGDWGLIRYGFISDASSGGNILAKWPLNRMADVKSGHTAPQYAAGTVHFQI